MGIETLNTAAHAAGFAMASDEASSESKADPKPDTDNWRSGDAILLDPEPSGAAVKAAPSSGDWFKSLLGVFGRGAPA